jgi:hypothetical protein
MADTRIKAGVEVHDFAPLPGGPGRLVLGYGLTLTRKTNCTSPRDNHGPMVPGGRAT